MIKAVLLDFDGTLVNQDILDVVCGIVGKEHESEAINKKFHEDLQAGREVSLIAPLITRINFLKGVSLPQIKETLDKNPYLVSGAKELLAYLNQNYIISILNSGNIMPILQYYQSLLGISYLVGTKPKMEGETIEGIAEDDFPGMDFKLIGIQKILESREIHPQETVALGDSPVDKKIFDFAGKSIAINPKGGVENFADYVIENDLTNVIPILESLRT
jgi:phosphoserine phosphatase